MIRRIVCEDCKQKQLPMHPEDVVAGFKRRIVALRVKCPDGLAITVNGVKCDPLRSLVCDDCNQELSDGTGAYAVTMWQANREPEPGNWEIDYLATES